MELKEYFSYFDENVDEVVVFLKELFILVIDFFCDVKVFNVICYYIEEIIVWKCNGDSVCFWVVGCVMGEEVYLFVIVFFEVIENVNLEIMF